LYTDKIADKDRQIAHLSLRLSNLEQQVGVQDRGGAGRVAGGVAPRGSLSIRLPSPDAGDEFGAQDSQRGTEAHAPHHREADADGDVASERHRQRHLEAQIEELQVCSRAYIVWE